MWYKRYAIPFQSRLGKQYVAYIKEQESGDLVTLTGADDPFITKENDDVNIFIPIRKQTGYLRILDNTGGTLLETIMPQNNTEKMVVLMEGDKVAWKGFLCAEAFTQPWDGGLTELEFPIKSVLAALNDITVSTSFSGSILRLSRMIAEGVNALCGGEPFESVTHVGSIVMSEWMIKKINHGIFFSEETYQSGGDVVTAQEGVSYYKAITEIMKTIGLTARQEGNSLFFARYDGATGYDILVNTMSWNDFVSIAVESQSQITQGTEIPSVGMLKNLDFRKNKNEVTFTPGGRKAKVVLNIAQIPATMFGLQLPETTEDFSEVNQIIVQPLQNKSLASDSFFFTYNKGNIVFVQKHPVRTGGQEVFAFNKYTHSYDSANSRWIYNYQSAGSFQECVDNTPLVLTYFNDIGVDSDNASLFFYVNYNIVTGAFPVRWYFKEGDSLNAVSLVSGLLLMQKVLRGNDVISWNNEACYSISTPNQQTINGESYININFSCHCFFGIEKYSLNIFGHSFWLPYSSFNNLSCVEYRGSAVPDGYTLIDENVSYKMACSLCIGNKWWNGSQWQDTETFFYIDFEDESIVTNKDTINANVEGESGWFIPVSSEMEGIVTFKILSWCYTDYTYTLERDKDNPDYNIIYTPRPYAKIIDGLSVGVSYSKEVTESERSTNAYRRVIMQSGFSDEKSIELTIGTDNNNKDSTPSFLKAEDGTTNIEYLQYYSGGNIVNERPEEHLLNRLATYYNQVRRAFRATVTTGIDLLTTRYSYLGRYFFGVDKKHDWRNDEQEVRFIEVN